jgi:hypothetical protein
MTNPHNAPEDPHRTRLNTGSKATKQAFRLRPAVPPCPPQPMPGSPWHLATLRIPAAKYVLSATRR